MTFDESVNPKNLSREAIADLKYKCDKDLLYFTRLFYRILRGGRFIVNDHHRFLADQFDDVENYKVKLLNINIPPRHSKTELAINYIARGIGKNNSSNWLYISASDELRSEASTRIRDIVNTPLFKRMYGLEMKKDQQSKNLWRTSKGGGLKTATIFGQVTGFGAGQMTEAGMSVDKDTFDLIRTFEGSQVWDDINKTEDSQAENANNDKVSRVIFNTLLSRENSKDTPIIHIQQRTGMSDATASLMEHYGYDNSLNKCKDEKYRFVIMPIVKEDGRPLWEAKFSLEDIHKLKTSPKTAHVFETQYMQNPLPSEGVLFIRNEMNWFTMDDIDPTRIESKLGNIDVADTGRDHYSFPSGCLIGEKFYVTEWLYTQENTEYTRPKTASIVNSNKINHLGLETNSMGREFGRALGTELNAYTNMYPKPATTNKVSRIINRAEFIRKYFVFRSDAAEGTDYDKALKHLFRFMKDGSFKIDDAPDSLSGLALLIQQLEFPQFRNI